VILLPYCFHHPAGNRTHLPRPDQRADHEGTQQAGVAGGAGCVRRDRGLRAFWPVDPGLPRGPAGRAGGCGRPALAPGRAAVADWHGSGADRGRTADGKRGVRPARDAAAGGTRGGPRHHAGRQAEPARGAADATAFSGALVAVGVILWLFLRYCNLVVRVLRPSGVELLTRISGLLVSAIAVQLIAGSVEAFVHGAL